MKQNKTNRKEFEARALPQLDGLYRMALYVLDSESDARDVVQESFVKAYHTWRDGRFSSNSRIRLFKIMVNVLFNKYWPSPRRSSAINSADEIDLYSASSKRVNRQQTHDSGRVSFSAMSEASIKKAIKNLPQEFRLIVVLSMLEGFSYREIADVVGIDLETIRYRLRRGRRLMQRELIGQVECEDGDDMPAEMGGGRAG